MWSMKWRSERRYNIRTVASVKCLGMISSDGCMERKWRLRLGVKCKWLER